MRNVGGKFKFVQRVEMAFKPGIRLDNNDQDKIRSIMITRPDTQTRNYSIPGRQESSWNEKCVSHPCRDRNCLLDLTPCSALKNNFDPDHST